jgi:DNA invertase Pin-like site-specific DNA recombinase
VDLYNIVAQLQAKGVEFKVIDDPSIDTTSRTGKLVMGILALIAEFENDIRREQQLDGIAKAKERGVRFGAQSKQRLSISIVCSLLAYGLANFVRRFQRASSGRPPEASSTRFEAPRLFVGSSFKMIPRPL